MFALMSRNPRNNEDVVASTILICSIPTYALFDSRSSHTFISTHFASRINKKLGLLGYKLVMSQPMGNGIVCSTIYRSCDVCINNIVISTDLIPLNIGHFDVIFMMD